MRDEMQNQVKNAQKSERPRHIYYRNRAQTANENVGFALTRFDPYPLPVMDETTFAL
jgi:hypothetical protein